MNIEEKTKLAHEWFMGMVSAKAPATVATAWKYADQMEAEAEKRIKAKSEKDAEESKVFFEKLTKNEDGSCKHFHTTLNRGECFDCGGKLNSADSSQLEQVLHDIDCYFDKTDNTQRDANNLIQSVYERLSGEVLNPSNSMELEWQPDWSIAPDWAVAWVYHGRDIYSWYSVKPIKEQQGWFVGGSLEYKIESAPSFNYRGDWKDSLRTRPQEKPKQHNCNCSHWKNSSFFMGDTFTCKDCGGSVTI